MHEWAVNPFSIARIKVDFAYTNHFKWESERLFICYFTALYSIHSCLHRLVSRFIQWKQKKHIADLGGCGYVLRGGKSSFSIEWLLANYVYIWAYFSGIFYGKSGILQALLFDYHWSWWCITNDKRQISMLIAIIITDILFK